MSTRHILLMGPSWRALGVLLESPGDVLRLLEVLLGALIENLYGEESALG